MPTSLLLAFLLALGSAVATDAPTDTTPADNEPAAEEPNTEEPATEVAEHEVVAIYFHRTQRCPTCKRIGSLAEGAVDQNFAKEIATGAVRFQYVDFQDKKNAKLAKGYHITSPTLVLVNVHQGKTACWTAMPKVWQLIGKPAEFEQYVSDGVTRYLKQSQEDAEQEYQKSLESEK
ncbi:nitrophenyl compound nitroreductase subunit ArsF family protein [Aeoliella mucimassa]|uniref:Thioredoxin domain-containing protein n=1 Tax=Aeoliella mucimassa TaxID=2527972 RepID=A0A518AS08_9BACT|nr:nitrophenyl compound nitroreductase subunit ArsF family protein [Aeoliella mucimassa]QDU57504.1 hypothetical protein Pan181_37210 [Aeoliella mucimassa]